MRALLTALALFLGYVQCTPFQATLNLPSKLESGQEVVCTVIITNRDTRDYYLYTRNTPLNGLKSDIFHVTQSGMPVSYDGFFFKRSPVTLLSDRVLIKSSDSITANIDLTTGYSFSLAGSYVISLNTKIFFSKGKEQIQEVNLQSTPASTAIYESKNNRSRMTIGEKHRLERSQYKLEATNGIKVTGTLRSVTFGGTGDSVAQSEANTAWRNAYKGVVNSIPDMANNPNHYKGWFGMSPGSTTWSDTLSTIQKKMEEYVFRLYFHGQECEENDFAYTYYNSDTLYMCDGYFYAKAYGYDSKYGTIVHEMTHAVVGTEDLAYGQYDCQVLAKYNPTSAIMNADNYEYFVESLP